MTLDAKLKQPDMPQIYDTIIVGGGQGGLSTSYYLTQQKRHHVVLEQATQVAPAWRNGRWDSFTLVTPNWAFLLPGAEYNGEQPEGFLGRDEVVAAFENYVTTFALPIIYNTTVIAVERNSHDDGFLVRTHNQTYEARNVVIATGLFQRPRFHSDAQQLSPHVKQIHSGDYRNPAELTAGAVLVVGSSQSGCQIAQEIHESGRTVYLCVGKSGRAPRRYRGKDSYEWAKLIGLSDRTVDMLPSPKQKFAANPHMSGKINGGDINLHKFARDGIRLLGHLEKMDQNIIRLAPDLKSNLEFSDKLEAASTNAVDAFIEKNGLDLPTEKLAELTDGFQVEIIQELDVKKENVNTVIWAIGYNFDFNIVKFPVFDEDGYPIQQRGVTAQPGLYFVGLPWLHKQKSGLLSGVGEDAAYIASILN